MHQQAGIAVVVQPEVQIVVDAVEVLNGRAPPEQMGGRGLVNILGQLHPRRHLLVVKLFLMAQGVGLRPLVAGQDFLRRHFQQGFQGSGHG